MARGSGGAGLRLEHESKPARGSDRYGRFSGGGIIDEAIPLPMLLRGRNSFVSDNRRKQI